MKESYVEGLANPNGLESYGGARKDATEALTGERVGPVWSREKNFLWGADAGGGCGKPQVGRRYRETHRSPTRSETWRSGMYRSMLGILLFVLCRGMTPRHAIPNSQRIPIRRFLFLKHLRVHNSFANTRHRTRHNRGEGW